AERPAPPAPGDAHFHSFDSDSGAHLHPTHHPWLSRPMRRYLAGNSSRSRNPDRRFTMGLK
ncbi:MAG TPA: hypothetical protein VHI96_09765, partial [Solirubrobacterales bacterium]|nr:hypothetical protein [Solirubrobacterales bacterium]